jgi:hypothetical protein
MDTQEKDRERMQHAVKPSLRQMGVESLVDVYGAASFQEVNKRGLPSPHVLVMNYNSKLVDEYQKIREDLNGTRVILTYQPLEQTVARYAAQVIEAPHTLVKPSNMDNGEDPFYHSLSGYVCEGLSPIDQTEVVGVIGTGGVAGAVINHPLLQKAGITTAYLYNGKKPDHHPAKATALKEVRQRLDREEDGTPLEVHVASSVAEMRLHCGIILYTIGNREWELKQATTKGAQRKDFLKPYVESTLSYSRDLIGYRGRVLGLTNPGSPLLTMLYAGAHLPPDMRKDIPTTSRNLVPIGVMSDKPRAIDWLLERGAEVRLLNPSTATINDVEVSLVGPRDALLPVNAKIVNHTLEDIMIIAENLDLNRRRFSETALMKGIRKKGIDTIVQSGDYFAEEAARHTLDHIEAMNGKSDGNIELSGIGLVDLEGEGYFHKEFQLLDDYKEHFPHGVITGWEFEYASGFPKISFIDMGSKKRKELLSRLVAERSLILNAIKHYTSGKLGKQADKVRDFFGE